ncbi:MAG: heavy metal translocating P-type ATPase [Helicobacteraceae bacterium]|jgi:Cu+-exporting ATPase|nr:heavy metal translocating P-type ATPase [Helicobacteraceae bacterium]
MRCDHCGLEIASGAEISEGGHNFCCKGCQGVFFLLRDLNLGGFYELKGEQKLDRPKENRRDLERFDSEIFAKRFISVKDNLCEAALALEGIHCAACVWLNEKVINRLDGVIDANINFTTNKAKIVFDPAKIKLSKIVETIRSIGYDASPYDPKLAEEGANKERKEYYTRLIVAIFAAMNIMWLAVARYLGLFSGMDEALIRVIYFVEFCLATPTLFFSGWVFFRGGYYGLKNGFVTMDLLVATGGTLTYGYSIYAAQIGAEPYFDSVTMIIAFVLIGKFLEVRAKKSAVDTLDSLIAAAPQEVTRVTNGAKERVAPEAIAIGEIIESTAGERIVFDCEVLSGTAALDTASLTGESEPKVVTKGDKALGGAINTDGVLLLRVEKDYEHSTFRAVYALLEQSLENRPSIANLANRLSRRFSSTILAIAALTFCAWFFALDSDFDRALRAAISVIVIACPCALALATPIASVIGTLEGARRNILFRSANVLETLAKAKFLLLDKTGTLTIGKPQVVQADFGADFDPAKLAALVGSSSHPISKGVAEYLDGLGGERFERFDRAAPIGASGDLGAFGGFGDLKTIAGRGVAAGALLGGNEALMRENNAQIDAAFDAPCNALSNAALKAGSRFYFAENGVVQARFLLADKLKADATDAIAALKRMGLEIAILTGDSQSAAFGVASALEIGEVHCSLLPQDKAALVDRYRQKGIVVMVGDGLNDAIALAKANVAIAMHGGADISISASDLVLLKDSLSDLAFAIKLSKKTYRVIKQNIALSIVYNACLIPLACMGYIIPLIAALSMSFSSLLVVGNSLRIKSFRQNAKS